MSEAIAAPLVRGRSAAAIGYGDPSVATVKVDEAPAIPSAGVATALPRSSAAEALPDPWGRLHPGHLFHPPMCRELSPGLS